MAKKFYLPKDDLGKSQWLSNFSTKLPAYSAKYGISAGELADMSDSSENFGYWLDAKNQYDEFNKKVTAYKNELRDGVPPGGSPSVAPAPPVLGPAPAAAAPGIFKRATSLAGRIKAHVSYTIADGQDLGIEGAEETIDLPNMKPILDVSLVAGRPRIDWEKQGMDAIEIHVSRAPADPFAFLAIDTIPDYDDTSSLPAPGQSAVWRYKAIYRLGDDRVGQWSDEASVVVMG